MGLETVGFVTKGYTATLLNLFLFGLKLGYQKHQLTKVEVGEELAKLAKAIQEIDSVIYKTEQFWQKRKRINRGTRFIAIGYVPILVRQKSLRRSLQKQFAYLPKDLKSKPICMLS